MKFFAPVLIVLSLSLAASAPQALFSANEPASGFSAPAKPSSAQSKGLHYSPEIPGCGDAIAGALDFYYFATPESNRMPELANRMSLEVQPPIGTYRLSAADVLAGKGLNAARFINLIFCVQVSGIPVGKIIVTPENRAGTYTNRHLGFFDDYKSSETRAGGISFLNNIAHVQSLDEVKNGSFELRLLYLPPYQKVGRRLPEGDPCVYVLWLRSDTPGGDLIYTLPNIAQPQGLEQNKLYTAMDMLKIIMPAVKQYVDSPEPPPFVPNTH